MQRPNYNSLYKTPPSAVRVVPSEAPSMSRKTSAVLQCTVDSTLEYLLTILYMGMKGHLMNGEFTIHPTTWSNSNNQKASLTGLFNLSQRTTALTQLTPVAVTQIRHWSTACFVTA